MSYTEEMPIDKESAKHLLCRFMENASNKKLMKQYQKAVDISYGTEFEVKLDLSNRMTFSCEVCHKEMNNVKSLYEHSVSGSHLKSKDTVYYVKRERSLPYKKIISSSSRSSQIPLIRKIKESSVIIIGLQYVEVYLYCGDVSRFYHKCNLCGAYGKADDLYNHLIGDPHTDKYIKSRVKLVRAVYGPSERDEYRQEIAKREYFSIDDIPVIKDRQLYPYKWEIHGSGRSKPKNRKNEFDFGLLINRRSDVESLPKTLATPQKEYMSYQYFESILLKFNAIIQVHLNDASDIYSGKDLRFAMVIHFYIMHILFYQFRNLRDKCHNPRSLEFCSEQDGHIKKAMGSLRHTLRDLYSKKYAKEFGDLPTMFHDPK